MPRLLEKVIAAQMRAVVRTSTADRIEHLNRVLWTYRNDAFLPHGSKADGFAEAQPVYLTAAPNDRPNGATVLLCVDGAGYPDVDMYARCLDLFDGNDPLALEQARGRWRAAKDAGHDLVYWQQNARGGWTRAN